MPTNELRVFISSTFLDLQEERDHLMKKIFPEVRAFCRERGITFTEVDLRWGLTHEDHIQGRVLRTCLTEIDKCRPYFIGITGSRYGYVLDPNELYKDGELLARYPWVEDAALEGASMGDMEFRYGALLGREEVGRMKDESFSPARFFFRRERATLDKGEQTEDSKKLEALKTRVRASGLPIEEFSDLEQLGKSVFDAIIEIINTDFAHARPPTPLEQEHAKHESFAASRRVAYIPNLDYVRRLNEFAKSEEPPLVIYAESGSGKSSLVAYWAENYRRKNPATRVIEHYVGVGATQTDHFGLMRHIMTEIKDMMHRDDEIPAKPEELERAFANFLGFTLENPVVIILDGINQLSGQALNLEWLPEHIPKNIRLIVTTTVESTLVQMRERGWGTLGMQPLSEKEREAIIVRYLGDYRKSLSPQQVGRIARDQKCAHPLFLRTMLEELRLFGKHEELDRAIDHYLETTGTEDLFQQVLERIEEDYNTRFVREVMSFLWASRAGLTESELAELAGVGTLKISGLLNGLDYHLVRRDLGCLTFFHDYLRRAVEKRYLQEPSKQIERYQKLAEFFQQQVGAEDQSPSRSGRGAGVRETVPLRLARELIHTLQHSGNDAKLTAALAIIPVFLTLWKHDESAVLTLWQQLSGKGHEPERYYPISLGVLRTTASALLPEALVTISNLFQSRSAYDLSIELLNELLVWAEECKDEKWSMQAHFGLGVILSRRGDYNQSMLHLTESLRFAESLVDKNGMANATSNMGNVHLNQGRYAKAMACYERALQMKESLGDKRGISIAIGNMGIVHLKQGHYAGAMDCYELEYGISESLGNKCGMSTAIGSIGSAHWYQGHYAEAMSCYERYYALAELLGDKSGITTAVGNMGHVHHVQGRYIEAMACFERKLTMSELLGEKSKMSYAMGCIGSVHIELGRHAEALKAFRKAHEGHLQIGSRDCLTGWLDGISVTFLKLALEGGERPVYLIEYLPETNEDDWHAAALRLARENAQECVQISTELSKPDTLFSGRVLLARIDAAEGNVAIATEKLEAMLGEATEEEQIAELHYWLWKVGGPSPPAPFPLGEGSKNGLEALTRYTALYSRFPKFEFRKRIAELNGESVPKNADDLVGKDEG